MHKSARPRVQIGTLNRHIALDSGLIGFGLWLVGTGV